MTLSQSSVIFEGSVFENKLNTNCWWFVFELIKNNYLTKPFFLSQIAYLFENQEDQAQEIIDQLLACELLRVHTQLAEHVLYQFNPAKIKIVSNHTSSNLSEATTAQKKQNFTNTKADDGLALLFWHLQQTPYIENLSAKGLNKSNIQDLALKIWTNYKDKDLAIQLSRAIDWAKNEKNNELKNKNNSDLSSQDIVKIFPITFKNREQMQSEIRKLQRQGKQVKVEEISLTTLRIWGEDVKT